MAFSISVESPMKGTERISRSLGVYAGKVSITSYSQTLVECTAITKYFVPTGNATTGGYKDGVISVQIDGPSSEGYSVSWDYGTGAFKCYHPTTGYIQPYITLATSAGVAGNLPLLVSDVTTASTVTIGCTGTSVGTLYVTLPANVAREANANTLIGTFGFVAVGFVRA